MDKILDYLAVEREDDFCNRRYIVIKFALLASIILFSLFIFINLFMHHYKIAIIDFISATIAILTFVYMLKTKDILLTTRIATLNVVIFFIFFAYIAQAVHFSLIWTIFVPVYAIITNGKKVGLYFSLFFYAFLFTLSYQNINIWDSGEWLFADWMRLVLASTILTACMYIYEALLDKAQKELETVRLKELQKTKELQQQSITDQLTKLYNRRYYENMTGKLFSLAKRQNLFITFFILDIDYFKAYNDYYGHMRGDEALTKVADAVKKHIQRGDDFVFRLGGEEFAGIVLSKEKEKTHRWIAELTKKIESLHIEHKTSKISPYLTVSVGIATMFPAQNSDIDILYKYADKALYTAKESGRNQSQVNQDIQ